MASGDSMTLAQCLSEGRIPFAGALGYAMSLADCLRRVHESGKTHGALSPICCSLAGEGLRLAPAVRTANPVTPYTAPEVLRGSEPDARSDIFSFGAILFEMIAGRPAFDADTPAALLARIVHSPAPSTGNAAVDRIIGLCLVKNPEERTVRLSHILLQLRVLAAATARSGASGITANLSAERLHTIERRVEELRRHLSRFEQNMAADLVDIENHLREQGTAIESSRTAMSQTDDLVERVVEALESLQSAVLERRESGGKHLAFTVN
jgi:serine/threonine protein kinase